MSEFLNDALKKLRLGAAAGGFGQHEAAMKDAVRERVGELETPGAGEEDAE